LNQLISTASCFLSVSLHEDVIAPTENDWQEPPFNNRKLKSGEASVRITSKNASPIEYKVTILETPVHGKIIKVNDEMKIEKKYTPSKKSNNEAEKIRD
jgi:hypothetical protein